MVQLCVRILYARMAIYNIFKPLSLISFDIFVFKKIREVPSLGDGDICIIRYTKLMLVHSASCSEKVKNRLGCNSSILIMCVLMLTRQNMCIQPSMTFSLKYGSGVYRNCTFSLGADHLIPGGGYGFFVKKKIV